MKKLVILLALMVVASFAGQYDLLVAYCEGSGGYTISEFDSDSFYDSVTYMELSGTMVPASTLADYGCVFSWNNYQYVSGQGDAFGDYVTDYDGKVILLIWGITQCYGKIVTDPTLCPIAGGGNQYSSVNLGTIYEETHPIIDGDAGTVSSINGMYYWVSGSMESGALRVADNSAGTPLAAVNSDENCAALNVCPGSYKYWSGDGWTLMGNTIHLMMYDHQPGDPPYVYGMDPDDGDTGVPVDTDIVFHCADDLSPVDTDTIDFTVEDQSLGLGGGALGPDSALAVGWDNRRPAGEISGTLDIDTTDPKDVICTFTPDSDLPVDLIRCTVAAGLADDKGWETTDNVIWQFSTGNYAVVSTTWGAVKAEF